MDLERPLAVGARAKMILNMEITQDLLFLNEQGLMDYSLLVGIHNCPGEACPQCKDRRSTEVSPDGKVRSKDIHRNGTVLPYNDYLDIDDRCLTCRSSI